MRMGKGMVVGLLCLVLVFAICVPRAYSGTVTTYLDGAWFKMKLTAKGYKRDPNTGAYEKYIFSAPVYLHLTWVQADIWYKIDVWTIGNAGWAISDTRFSDTWRPGENFFQNGLLLWPRFTGGDELVTVHMPFISLKMSGGVLQQAKWQGTGEVFLGSFENGTKQYFGYFNLTGQTVDPSKLPFVP